MLLFCVDGQNKSAFASVSDHPFFVGVQYHPEFLSRPIKPSPPYFGLLLASVGRLPHYLQKGCRLSPRCGHSSLVHRGPRLVAMGMLSSLGSLGCLCAARPSPGLWDRRWWEHPGVPFPLTATAPPWRVSCPTTTFIRAQLLLTLSWWLEFQERSRNRMCISSNQKQKMPPPHLCAKYVVQGSIFPTPAACGPCPCGAGGWEDGEGKCVFGGRQ